jgi:hypothetical protein
MKTIKFKRRSICLDDSGFIELSFWSKISRFTISIAPAFHKRVWTKTNNSKTTVDLA